ncbi:HNH endonuclease signature motif containing protein [Devosia naphthalenivorans]|uniref:HNH endonuclease signature motif containing protein n=1 Tax=Devosia naphthalenivorans TaxID=2082392 RepID=UPI000D35DB60|nr:HNH endonuclease signature motif containing protein [Devosia naphthalenivorans]
MPVAPPRLCRCGNIVASGQRCACQIADDRARKARHDRRRPSSGQRGYNHEWRKARAAYLITHPHCTHPGCNAAASHVDHITPHKGDYALFWDRANWQALCAHHHNSTKQREERRQVDQ